MLPADEHELRPRFCKFFSSGKPGRAIVGEGIERERGTIHEDMRREYGFQIRTPAGEASGGHVLEAQKVLQVA